MLFAAFLHAHSWLLALGFWLLAFGFWLSAFAFGFWFHLAFDFWLLAFGWVYYCTVHLI